MESYNFKGILQLLEEDLCNLEKQIENVFIYTVM